VTYFVGQLRATGKNKSVCHTDMRMIWKSSGVQLVANKVEHCQLENLIF
jgi:hypothetical protein